MKVKMIMACDLNNGIGFNNSLPWPRDIEDMRMFKKMTTGKGNNVIVMGYNTWDSLPSNIRPLPNRMNVVLTSKVCSSHEPNLCYLSSIDDIKGLLDDSSNCYDELWIIGGKTLYLQAIQSLPIFEIWLTTFKQNYTCDIFCNIQALLNKANLEFDSKLVFENTTRKVECLKVKQRTIS